MSVAELVRRLLSRLDTTPEARPEACGTVRTVAPGTNTTFLAVRTREPAPMLAIRPVFAPVAPFAPETVEAHRDIRDGAPAGLSEEAWREVFEERAAIMEFDGGLMRADAEAAARGLLADGEVSARVARTCTGCEHFGRHRTCPAPVAAGLLTEAQGFGIAWPPEGHGAGCAAFSGWAARRPAGSPWRTSDDQPRG